MDQPQNVKQPRLPDPPQQVESSEESDEATPMGAIVITTILAVMILLFWFGMYILNLSRS